MRLSRFAMRFIAASAVGKSSGMSGPWLWMAYTMSYSFTSLSTMSRTLSDSTLLPFSSFSNGTPTRTLIPIFFANSNCSRSAFSLSA